eukprot:TRINITY_DN11814_c0_g1_i4.p1 TRINITY_DN11814_c0_g1~~TRINITY_DN11814_c0_g1_i4.p1  ORF type:complete len:765 (-),score=80.26 TRINITY_DN11814_c0_g1_i4:953-3187(-)
MFSAGYVLSEAHVTLLWRLGSTESIDLSDQMWNDLLLNPAAWGKLKLNEFETSVLPHLNSLVKNTPQTGNYAKLLYMNARLLNRLKPEGKSLASVPSALQFIRIVMAYMLEALDEELRDQVHTYQPPSPYPQEYSTLTGYFVESAVSFLLTRPISDQNQTIHLEILKLLLVCCSTQLFSGEALGLEGKHPFLDGFVRIGHVSKQLVGVLLKFYLAGAKAAEGEEQQPQGGILRMFTLAAAQLFYLPFRAYSMIMQPASKIATRQISDLSALLLLVLLYFPSPTQNSYVLALKYLPDADLKTTNTVDASAMERGASGDVNSSVSFRTLYEHFTKGLNNELQVLLLYALIHGCVPFRETVLVRSDLERFILPLLETLYTTKIDKPNQLYILQIVLLIFTHDASFCQNLNKIEIAQVPWFKEKQLLKCSMSSLMIIVLLTVIQKSLTAYKDAYLGKNTLAALENLVQHTGHINTAAAQKLTATLVMLAKRYEKLKLAVDGLTVDSTALQRKVSSGIRSDEGVGSIIVAAEWGKSGGLLGQDPGAEERPQTPMVSQQQYHIAMEVLEVFEESLIQLLRIINTIVLQGPIQNPSVIYALLHRQEVLNSLCRYQAMQPFAGNLKNVAQFFSYKVDEAAQEKKDILNSVEKVHEVITSSSKFWRAGELQAQFSQLNFAYEEETDSQNFFVPYIWTLGLTFSGLEFDLGNVRLFKASGSQEADSNINSNHVAENIFEQVGQSGPIVERSTTE